jgi:hypothetical protein
LVPKASPAQRSCSYERDHESVAVGTFSFATLGGLLASIHELKAEVEQARRVNDLAGLLPRPFLKAGQIVQPCRGICAPFVSPEVLPAVNGMIAPFHGDT